MSDLSPDGEHLLYVARNESKRRQDEAKTSLSVDALSSWTALCRPPWVKALEFLNVSDDWGGGAVCDGNKKVWQSGQNPEPETLIEPKDFEIQVAAGARFPPIYLILMQRNG